MFDDRSIDDISDEEIHELIVGRAREHQRLEFKADMGLSADKQQHEKEKLEMLMDVAAMANAEGGYIIYGVEDDGNNCASDYFKLTRERAKKIENKVDELAVVHISERIEGMEVRLREIQGNCLVVVRIPASSKAPHMVTMDEINLFQIRHDDHKRKMTIGEIRSAFNDDIFGRRLARVEQELSQLLEYMKNSDDVTGHGSTAEITPTANGSLLSEQRRKAIWEKYV